MPEPQGTPGAKATGNQQTPLTLFLDHEEPVTRGKMTLPSWTDGPRGCAGARFSISMAEPQVTLDVAGRLVEFLVDTGATYSALISFSGPSFQSLILLSGIDGHPQTDCFTCLYSRKIHFYPCLSCSP